MTKIKLNYLIITCLLIYFAFTLYGLFFNFSWVDESKYLIKGYLMASGKISLYNTAGFPYQHMPLIMLWFGIGQVLAGPSLLVARLQGLITSVAVLFFSYKLSLILKGKTAAIFTLIILCFSFNTALHYATATPQAIVALFFVLAFLTLYKALRDNSSYYFLLTSFLFTMIFLLRENFLPTLIFYYFFLLIILFQRPLLFLFNLLTSFILLFIVLYPCYPGIIKILANFPLLKLLLTTPLERQMLAIHWHAVNFTNQLKIKALFQLVRTYQLFFFLNLIIFIFYFFRLKKISELLKKPYLIYFVFMGSVILLNFFVHLFIAFRLSPRAIIPYFDYTFSLCAVLTGIMFSNIWKAISTKPFKAIFIYSLITLLIFSFAFSSSPLFQLPSKKSALTQIKENAQTLSNLIPAHKKVFFLGETMPLYLASRNTYWPLYNGLNFFKPGADTNTVKNYGFWNEELTQELLDQTDLVILEKSQLQRINQEMPLKNLKNILEKALVEKFYLIKIIEDYFRNDSLLIYKKKVLH